MINGKRLLVSSVFALLMACNNASPPASPTPAVVDTTPPTISLGTSSNSVTTEGGIIILTAIVGDDVGVVRVEFFEGSQKISEDLTAPYNHSIRFTMADNGTRVYTARAFDAAGNARDSQPVTVTVAIVPPDTTAPTIVSVSPANNATGVAADANIVITFSEPMNKLLTQSAYQSASDGLLPTQVQFTWNAEGTQLTINPNTDLLYNQGTSPASTAARLYAYQITKVAADLAGNEIAPASFSFATSRRITQALPALGVLSGNVSSDGTLNACFGGDPCVGDTAENLQVRGFISFDLAGLPPNIQGFELANLNLNQIAVEGNPFASLGGVQLEHVNFATLNPAVFNLPSLRALGVISTAPTLTVKTLSVLAAVSEDYANRAARGNRTQYRLTFPNATIPNGQPDAVRFAAPTAAVPSALSVRYLVP